MYQFVYISPDDSFSIQRTESIYQDYSDFQLHNHLTYEIFRFHGNNAVFQVEGRAYDLSCGDVMIFNSHEFHHITFELGKPYARSTIQIKKEYLQNFIQSDYDLFSGFERRRLGFCNQIKASDAEAGGLTAILDKTEASAFSDRPERDLEVQCAILQALIAINHLVVQSKDVSYDATHNQKIMEIIHYINQNLASDLSLDALEKKFFISKYHLAHIFKIATGFPINRYISNKRIKLADELIAEGMSTLDACVASGFNDYSNFYKSFKKLTGHSPRQSKKAVNEK